MCLWYVIYSLLLEIFSCLLTFLLDCVDNDRSSLTPYLILLRELTLWSILGLCLCNLSFSLPFLQKNKFIQELCKSFFFSKCNSDYNRKFGNLSPTIMKKSDDQPFHQYQQNKQSALIFSLNMKKTTMWHWKSRFLVWHGHKNVNSDAPEESAVHVRLFCWIKLN